MIEKINTKGFHITGSLFYSLNFIIMKNLYTLLLFISSCCVSSQVFINELDSDTPSTDDREFIELKSTTPNTFCVRPLRSRKGSLARFGGGTAEIWVPSRAPRQSSKKG